MNEEYKQLYSEIGRNSQITANVFLANVSVTAALIGYGLTSEMGVIFLSPFAIIIPSLFFVASQLESTTRIASYIKTFHESDSDKSNWESRWFSIRDQRLLPYKRKYTLSISGLYGLLSLTCLALAFFYWPYSYWYYGATGLVILILVVFGILSVVNAFSMETCKDYDEAWQQQSLS